jgi:hypothetical protein
MRRRLQIPWLRMAMMALLFIPGFFALSSCVVETPNHEVMMEGGNPEAEVYVDEAPPPPREEVIVGVAPGPSYLWVGGYWARHRSNWYWVQGRWAARPHPTAIWVSGRWESRGRGHVWVGGRWR